MPLPRYDLSAKIDTNIWGLSWRRPPAELARLAVSRKMEVDTCVEKIFGVNNVANEFDHFCENSEKYRKKHLWGLEIFCVVEYLVAGASRRPPDLLGLCRVNCAGLKPRAEDAIRLQSRKRV
jgi:hypothetical protein